MEPTTALPWIALLGLGALHGINPAMGWLFAVALGLQERDRRVVWGALGPLALGHALAIGAAVAVAVALGLVVPLSALKWIVAALLVGLGVRQLLRHRHPRFGGMKMNGADLTIWSFLMASAHGAGLMALPFVMGTGVGGGGAVGSSGALEAAGTAAGHAAHGAGGVAAHAHGAVALAGLPHEQLVGILATLVHTAGYLLVTGLVAVIVYERLGLRLLRSAWINLDLLWAVALILTGMATPLL